MSKPVVTLSDNSSEDAVTARFFLEDLSAKGLISLVSVKISTFGVKTNEGVTIRNLEEFEFFYNSFAV